MALDRQSIEKRDFPIGRRGYEPDAVDAHLREISEQVDELRSSSRQRTQSLASAASEQVRSIVEAAEASAAEIEREAQDEARSVREEAAEDSRRTRADAAAQARDHIDGVSQASASMLQRVDAMESELGSLVEQLRTGANRLTADLALLQANVGELSAGGGGGGDAAAAYEPPAAAPETDYEPELASDSEPEPELEPVLELEPDSEPEAEISGPRPAAGGGIDTEGARLVALNMALNGTSREETDRYLAENFELDDRGKLLDEVYARVD